MKEKISFENTQSEAEKIVGETFESMTLEEMALTQGSGDVIPQSTPGCFFASLGVGVTISAWKC